MPFTHLFRQVLFGVQAGWSAAYVTQRHLGPIGRAAMEALGVGFAQACMLQQHYKLCAPSSNQQHTLQGASDVHVVCQWNCNTQAG